MKRTSLGRRRQVNAPLPIQAKLAYDERAVGQSREEHAADRVKASADASCIAHAKPAHLSGEVHDCGPVSKGKGVNIFSFECACFCPSAQLIQTRSIETYCHVCVFHSVQRLEPTKARDETKFSTSKNPSACVWSCVTRIHSTKGPNAVDDETFPPLRSRKTCMETGQGVPASVSCGLTETSSAAPVNPVLLRLGAAPADPAVFAAGRLWLADARR